MTSDMYRCKFSATGFCQILPAGAAVRCAGSDADKEDCPFWQIAIRINGKPKIRPLSSGG